MKKQLIFLVLIAIFALAGCAATAKPLKVKEEAPAPQTGESPVFGRVSLIEQINGLYMPVNEIDGGALYLRQVGVEKVIKIKCSDSGEFGVYLPGGIYDVFRVKANDYDFDTEMKMIVPSDQKAVYAGTLVLDGMPAGIVPGSDESRFAFTVKDEQKDYEASIRKLIPDAEVKFYKSLLKPGGGLMTGDHPHTVFRSKDVERDLLARTSAVEEVVSGVVITLPYIINPVWLFTVPF